MLPWKMAEEIDFENGRISNSQHHVTLILILDRAIWHTVVHHLSTSTYTKFHSNRRNFLWKNGRTYVRRDGQTDIEAGFIRSTRRSRPKKPMNMKDEHSREVVHYSIKFNTFLIGGSVITGISVLGLKSKLYSYKTW